jgi:hypothetical protein
MAVRFLCAAVGLVVTFLMLSGGVASAASLSPKWSYGRDVCDRDDPRCPNPDRPCPEDRYGKTGSHRDDHGRMHYYICGSRSHKWKENRRSDTVPRAQMKPAPHPVTL